MLYPATTLTVVCLIVLARGRGERRSPIVLALSVWLGALLLGPLLFRYQVPYSVRADAYVATALAAVTLTYLVVRNEPQRAPTATDQVQARVEKRLAQCLGVAGILGCLLLLSDARTSGTPLSFGYLLDNLGSIRAERFDALRRSEEQSPAKVYGTYLASCSFLTVVAAARIGMGLRLLAAVNFGLLASVSLLVLAGRAALINLALLFVVSLYLLGVRLLPRSPRAVATVVLASVAVWFLAVPYLGTRERGADPTRILVETQRAELRGPIEAAAAASPPLELAAVSVGYFTSPLPTLAFYIGLGPPDEVLWGGYSFPLPKRTWAKLRGTIEPNQWLENRQIVFAPLENAGWFPNVWSTWLRDLLVDFGYLGAIVFSALFGAFIAWARNGFERTGHLYFHLYQALAVLTLTFGAFQNLLWDALLSTAFFATVALAVVVHVDVFRSGRRDPAASRTVRAREVGASSSHTSRRSATTTGSSARS